MKKVFTNSEIVHKFNEQTQSEGNTNNFNMYFEYPNIISDISRKYSIGLTHLPINQNYKQ